MEINFRDYISEEEIKEIIKDEVRAKIRRYDMINHQRKAVS